MKKTTLTLILGVFTASSFFSTLSYADGPQREWHPQGEEHHDRGNHSGPDHHDNRGFDHHDNRGPDHHERFREDHDHFAWRGHDFRRGRPLPPDFRGREYRIDDWHRRGLYEPPRGAYWSYIDGNYVLIAAATGIITSIILNNALGNN